MGVLTSANIGSSVRSTPGNLDERDARPRPRVWVMLVVADESLGKQRDAIHSARE